MTEQQPEAPAQDAKETPPTEQPAPEPPKVKPEPDWKAEARKWEQRAKDNNAKVQEFDKLVEASKTEQERAVEAARREGESAATERANSRLIAAETRALAAAAKFRDPMDALAQLRDSLGSVPVNDDGSVDSTVIQAALTELAAAKPYLLADDGTPGTPRPDPSQGAHVPSADAAADAEYERYFPTPNRT